MVHLPPTGRAHAAPARERVGSAGGGLVHEAVLYRDAGRLLAGTVPFVTEGLAAGEPVLVAAPPWTLARLREALPGADGRVRMVDMQRAGRNPGRILPGVLLAFAADHPRQRVRIVGEPVWAGRSELEYPACVVHEALINCAFAGRRVAVRCLYDAAGLVPGWLADAARTHPWIGTGQQVAPSGGYEDPFMVVAAFGSSLPPPPASAERLVAGLDELGRLRGWVAGYASVAGLPAGRVADLTIAVNELATNSIQHSGGPGEVAVWTVRGAVVCQVRDGGYIADPLAGRVPTPADAPGGGRGLVVVNELCDLVRVHTRPGHTTVEVRVRC